MVKIIIYTIISLSLIGIIYKDIKEFIIPNIFNLLLTISGVIFGIINRDLVDRIIVSSMMVFPFTLIYCYGYELFKKECLGIGDIKLVISLGLILGKTDYMPIILFFNMIFLLATIFIIAKYILHRKLPRLIPLGPFIIISFLITFWAKR